MSGKVYDGFKKEAPKSIHLKNIEYKSYPNMPATTGGVYGGSLYWDEVRQIK